MDPKMPTGNDIFGHSPVSVENADEKKTSKSAGTLMVELATEAGTILWHTPAGDSYLSLVVNGHREHHRLPSRASREYLTRLFYVETGRAPSATSLQDAIGTLASIARFDGEQHDVHVRVGGVNDRIYLDLGDAHWRVVEITSTGWRIVADAAVRFRRPRGLGVLPLPTAGGSVEDLRPFINVNEDDFPLVVAWLVAALRGIGPFPVLATSGEHGSAKSTTTRVIRRLIDPHDSELRRPPRNTEDLMIAAQNAYVVTVDNVSSLSDWLSDDLAVLATGGGLSKRELYADSDECHLKAQRPIIVNGIGQVITRPDLLDRAIVLTCPVIREGGRRTEAEFWEQFSAGHGRILGALLDAVVMALSKYTTTTLTEMPRMADFAVWTVAAESALPWPAGMILSAYLGNRQGAVEAGLDGDPVVEVIRVLAPWEGTASDLLGELTRRTPDHITRTKGWFTKPRQVSDALRRLAPGLRRTGIDVTFTRAPHSGRRLIHLERMGTESSPSSPASPRPDLRADWGDEAGDAGRGAGVHRHPETSEIGRSDDGDAGDAGLPLLSEAPDAVPPFGISPEGWQRLRRGPDAL